MQPADTILFSLPDITLVATIVECFVLAIIARVIPSPSLVSRRLLGLLFLAIAAESGCMLFLWNTGMRGTLSFLSPLIIVVTTAALMLKGPLLYFYLRTFTTPKYTLGRRHLGHLAPPILALAVAVAGSLSPTTVTQAVDPNTPNWWTFTWWSLLRTSPVLYALLTLYSLRNMQSLYDSHYTSDEHLDARWIRLLIFCFLAQWSLGLFTHIAGQYLPYGMASKLGQTNDFIAFLLVNVLFIYCFTIMRRLIPVVAIPGESIDLQLDSHIELSARTSPQGTEAPLTQGSKNADEQSYKYLDDIRTQMEQHKIYLNPTVNLDKFAAAIGAPAKEVSRTINANFDENFSEFVNKYRIQEAMRILQSEEHKETPVSEVISLSGFNSKSAFHRFFKRYSDLSPTEYRLQHLSKKATQSDQPSR